jgi:hypothetical protein
MGCQNIHHNQDVPLMHFLLQFCESAFAYSRASKLAWNGFFFLIEDVRTLVDCYRQMVCVSDRHQADETSINSRFRRAVTLFLVMVLCFLLLVGCRDIDCNFGVINRRQKGCG